MEYSGKEVCVILNRRTKRVSWLAVAIPVIAFLGISAIPTEPRNEASKPRATPSKVYEPWGWIPADWREPAKD
jgi:hypothetical protein